MGKQKFRENDLPEVEVTELGLYELTSCPEQSQAPTLFQPDWGERGKNILKGGGVSAK